MNMLKLAIIATHPVQYTAPVFRAMTQKKRLELKVFYTWSQTRDGQFYDREFGQPVAWDVPVLEGYDHEFIDNVASDPGTHHFGGIRTPSLIPAIESWGANAVLVIGWNHHAHLQAMRHFKGRIPVFFRGDSTLLDRQPGWRTWLRSLVLRWIYKHVDVAISVGRRSRDYFSWCGVPRSQIAFAPHCVDNLRFADNGGHAIQQAASWREQLGIGKTDLVIGFAGKLIAKKDPLLLLKAFLQCGEGAHLVLFGSGELDASLRAVADGHRNVHFMPFQNQSQMPAVYRLCDLFVLPSKGPGETWGLAINEAMACGRPVVASSMVGAAIDLIQPGFNGWQFGAGDERELADVLRNAMRLGQPGLRQLGDNARRFIRDWSIEVCAESITSTVRRHCQLATLQQINPNAMTPARREDIRTRKAG